MLRIRTLQEKRTLKKIQIPTSAKEIQEAMVIANVDIDFTTYQQFEAKRKNNR